MKIALLVSGVYKNATVPLLNFLNYLRNQPNVELVDVYIHLWWDKSYVGKRYRENYLHVVEDDPTDDIQTQIKPIRLILEPQFIPDLTSLPRRCEAGAKGEARELAYFATLSQIESCKRCLHLIDDMNKYDCIWRHRADLFIEKPYTFDITDAILKSKRIWIADGAFFTGYPFGDWSILGNVEGMSEFINNWGALFINHCISRGHFSHIHIYLPDSIRSIGYEPIRWFIPLNITRHSSKHNGHYIWDTNRDLSIKPYISELLDKSRF